MLTVDYDSLGLRAGELVLDLGCGRGRHALEAHRRGAHVVAIDLLPDDLIETASWLAAMEPPGSGIAVRADGRRLPFADATFDHVVASEILEHVPDDGAILAEIRRVLRPGGNLAVTVPRFWPEAICWALSSDYHWPAVDGGHVRIYRRSQLRRRITEAGFSLTGRAHHAHALHSPFWWLRCAVGLEREDHPLVRAYGHVLEWDLVRRPVVTRAAERALDPVLGKSYAVYARAV